VTTRDLTRYGWLSLAVALATMGLKLVAWQVTGSVGLLSDAFESSVNLVAAVLMLVALTFSAQPPDDDHQFGHEKAELVSASAEGLMVVLAASLIVWTAVDRLLDPRDVEQVGLGLAVSVGASALNLAASVVLTRAGRRHRSAALLADGRHLLVDVWTSAGVVLGVILVSVSGIRRLDPLVALAVGVNVVVSGVVLLRRSVGGLMDPPLDAEDLATLRAVLARYEAGGVHFHAVRSRVAGPRRFVSMHVLVPGRWTVSEGHALLERLEADLRSSLGALTVDTHLEPIEDPASYLDTQLDRAERGDTPRSGS
jgi:cation diffusion facilitator family transporter